MEIIKMRLLLLFTCFGLIYCVKNNVKSLTESHGQEIIEIGTPIKELPPYLEEEPSAEEDEDTSSSSATILPATKKETKKTTTVRKPKENEKDESKQEDDETKIEKELAEIYKDNNIDYYKSDSGEVSDNQTKVIPKVLKINETDKSIGRRQNKNFKFHPDTLDQKEVEHFRTSVDEISCERKVLSATEETLKVQKNSACSFLGNAFLMARIIIIAFVCY